LITGISDPTDLQQPKIALQDEIKFLRQQLTEYKARYLDHLKQLDSLSSALQESDKHYDSLFSQLPRGMREVDYSTVKRAIDKLQAEGVEDLQQYFNGNPEYLRELVSSIDITNVNQALLSIHREESLEKYLEGEDDIDEWWDDGWSKYYAAEFAALVGPDKIYEDERVDFRSDGSKFETSLITTIVGGSEHSWNKVITIFEDVTERNKNQAALIEAKILAEKSSKAKSEFLSSMSHELRTPLNAILGFSQLFEYDQSLGEQRQSNARAINDAGKHLLKLVDEILDLSRIESGRVDLSIEAIPLETVIKDSLTWVADMAEGRGVTINFDPKACRGMLVEADAIRLKQVFLNLLSNAVKYNRENGKVDIVCLWGQNGFIRIGVTDTGPGISENRLGELFKPFNRLGAEFSGIEGTGIGLVITRQLVNLMQGELEVDSSPGIGSTFTLLLRSIEPQAGDDTISSTLTDLSLSPIASVPTAKPKILVAEDNPVNQQLMSAQLDMLGYSADYAENGIEALKLWKTGNYQLLLTDIRMPEMDGYELIGQIRALESNTITSPIIAVTANAMESDVKRCFDTGANDVISKPFGLDDLKQKLAKWSPQQIKPKASKTASRATDDAPDEAIDLELLRESVGDKVEVHRRLLKSYIDALPQALDDIQQAFGWRNHDQLGEYVHKLKSSSGSLGATRLASLCATLELACREGREAEINALVPQLMQAAEPVVSFVEAFCGESAVELSVAPSTPIDDDATKSQITVLLVDDDYIMHRVVTVILNDLGIHRVHTALSGHRALEILEEMQNGIDIIICDLNMPEMDGIELTRHLSRQKYAGSLALLSGEDIRILKTVEKLAIEHELQVLGVLEKPVTLAKITQLLETYDQVNNEWTVGPAEVFSADELLHAINEDQLDTYFQPKIDVKTRQIVGVEALVRWIHPTAGIVSPGVFIPLAEENNLIFKLTGAVCRKALQHAAVWQKRGIELDVALNISVDALNDLDWPDAMAAQVEASGLQPTAITFEITESRLMEHIVVALDILSRLSLKRFKLSIDDFGTGYSSMEQLQRIPFSELKIDRAFVRGASEDASARAILESSVLLAKKLDMKIVAEGVETEEDWNLVAELGCDQVQGYYIAKPMPADQLVEWLSEWQTGVTR
jgi:EAL domain-containing protein (putative c-di-GMP-specific phosphodiesterase class I)/signal transduction histidine kinase/DNA-binding response OmpR family regulator/HPt (histidine-containing phosphotransfer) domain-containing protein